ASLLDFLAVGGRRDSVGDHVMVGEDGRRGGGIKPVGRGTQVGGGLQREAGGVGRPSQEHICSSGADCQLREEDRQRNAEYRAIPGAATLICSPVQSVA